MTSFALGPKEDPISLVAGSSSQDYLFCLLPLTQHGNSTKSAIGNALAKVDADAIVNMTVERRTFLFPPFFCTVTTSVMGTAINYTDAPNFRRREHTHQTPLGKQKP